MYVSRAMSPGICSKCRKALISLINAPQPQVEEGYAGFIFYRKGKAPRGEGEVSNKEKPPEGRQTEVSSNNSEFWLV